MCTKKDNEDERFARIDALMEDYRVNHGDLEHYIRKAHTGMREGRDGARQNIDGSRQKMNSARRQLRKSKG